VHLARFPSASTPGFPTNLSCTSGPDLPILPILAPVLKHLRHSIVCIRHPLPAPLVGANLSRSWSGHFPAVLFDQLFLRVLNSTWTLDDASALSDFYWYFHYCISSLSMLYTSNTANQHPSVAIAMWGSGLGSGPD
jgi:hypothetical protein